MGLFVILMEITTLNKDSYFEKKSAELKFTKKSKGPHNIDFSSNLLTWDYFNIKFNFFAGYRRMRGKK